MCKSFTASHGHLQRQDTFALNVGIGSLLKGSIHVVSIGRQPIPQVNVVVDITLH